MASDIFTNPVVPGVPSPIAEVEVDSVGGNPGEIQVKSTWLSSPLRAGLTQAGRQFRILIEKEYLIVDAGTVGGTTWKVTRGAEGSEAGGAGNLTGPHAAGTAINHVITAGALVSIANVGSELDIGIAVSANRVLKATDAGKSLDCNSSSLIEITIPLFATEPIVAGSVFEICKIHPSGEVKAVKATSGVTIIPTAASYKLRTQGSIVGLRKRDGGDNWVISGDYE